MPTMTNDEMIAAWCAGEQPQNDAAIDWLRSRPAYMRELMIRFPPSCVVQSAPGHVHHIPAPGTLGVLISWYEPGERNPNGLMNILQLEDALENDSRKQYTAGQCLPEHLAVVAYWKGWTPERMKKLFLH